MPLYEYFANLKSSQCKNNAEISILKSICNFFSKYIHIFCKSSCQYLNSLIWQTLNNRSYAPTKNLIDLATQLITVKF